MARAISITSPDLILSCSALDKSRSPKTFPELGSIAMGADWLLLALCFAISQILCCRFGCFEPGVDDFHILLRSGDAALALLLKAMQDKDGLFELHGVD